MSRRRSTIYDTAALRLHPNGVRVARPRGVVKQPTSSVVTAKKKGPLFDARGNWAASDAGGDGRVVKRRKVSEVLDTEKGEDDVLEQDVEEGQSGVPAKRYKDARTNRRVAFESDLTFLAELSPPESGASLPRPSSDFLKCIHHFACQHYASSGQLFDSAAQYRKAKKEKRRLRMLQRAQASGYNEADAAEESEEQDEDSVEEGPPVRSKDKAKARTAELTLSQRDMYKAFNGTALLCIGMLLQSHVSSQLTDPERCKPDGWDDELPETEADEENLDGTAESDGGNRDGMSTHSSSPT